MHCEGRCLEHLCHLIDNSSILLFLLACWKLTSMRACVCIYPRLRGGGVNLFLYMFQDSMFEKMYLGSFNDWQIGHMLLFWHADEDRGYWVEMACPTADLLLALHSYPVVMYALVWYGMVLYGMEWMGMPVCLLWNGMLWYGLLWNGGLWYGWVW